MSSFKKGDKVIFHLNGESLSRVQEITHSSNIERFIGKEFEVSSVDDSWGEDGWVGINLGKVFPKQGLVANWKIPRCYLKHSNSADVKYGF